MLGHNAPGIDMNMHDSERLVADCHRILDGDELNLILLKLVEYLGHTNPIVCGVAFNEVCSIAC